MNFSVANLYQIFDEILALVFKSESEWVEWVENVRVTPSRLGVDFWAESTPEYF